MLISVSKKVFFNKAGLFVFIICPEQSNDHPKSFKVTTINFLCIYVGLTNAKTLFFRLAQLHYVQFATKVDEHLNF